MPNKALFERNLIFRNFISATSVSLLGTHIFDWTIPVFVSLKTQSPVAIALATIALHLPFVLMAPLTGYIVDHFNKRKVMLASDIGQVFCMAFLFFYQVTGVKDLWPLLLVVFIAKTLMIMFETVATFQLVPALVKQGELAEANSWFLSSQRLIQIVGPILAGSIMEAFGFRACIFANLISFSATLWFVLRMPNLNELIIRHSKIELSNSISVRKVMKHFGGGIRYIWRSPLFRPFVAMMFIWNLSPLVAGTPAVIHYFMQTKGLSALQYSFITSLIGVASIGGFLIAGRLYEKYRFRQTFWGSSLWLSSFSSVAVCFSGYPLLMAIILSISKAGSSVLSMGTFVLRQSNIPMQQMGTVNASLRMFFMSSSPISSALQAFLLIRIGTVPTLALGAIALWGTSYFAWVVANSYAKIQRIEEMKEVA